LSVEIQVIETISDTEFIGENVMETVGGVVSSSFLSSQVIKKNTKNGNNG
jgi:hypothetical protein